MSENAEASETVAHMNGKWQGQIHTMGEKENLDVFIEISESSLRVTKSDEQGVVVDDDSGTWDWFNELLIYSGAPYFVEWASSEELIFGKLKSPYWAGPTEWKTNLKREGDRKEAT